MVKKLRIARALETAIRRGETRTAGAWAKRLGVSYPYIRIIADEHGLQGALKRYGRGAARVTAAVGGHKESGKMVSPFVYVRSGPVYAAGFGIGDELVIRAIPGRIIITGRQGAAES